jgi:hypothetical protein
MDDIFLFEPLNPEFGFCPGTAPPTRHHLFYALDVVLDERASVSRSSVLLHDAVRAHTRDYRLGTLRRAQLEDYTDVAKTRT